VPSVRGVDVLRGVVDIPLPPGVPSSRARRRHEAIEIARNEDLAADAAYAYRIVPIDAMSAGASNRGGRALRAPPLVPAAGELTAIGCVVCTLGAGLEQRVAALFAERRTSLALALDALGNELLYALSRRVRDRMLGETTRRRRTMAGELHPGDPGLDLAAQPALLHLAGAHSIGVTLTEGLLMHPRKSLSMMLGVGKDLPQSTSSRCERCPSSARCRQCVRAETRALAG
jgi:hypothetical protein